MKRSETEYPNLEEVDVLFCEFLLNAWSKGWLDEYSDDHFLIKAIENRLTDFIGIEQLINNNINQYNIVSNGTFNSDSFCTNFCINFSMKMKGLSSWFGEEEIKKFVVDQMSAGKRNYREDAFFEALSEVSILSFIVGRIHWNRCEYEPLLNRNLSKANPEARFVYCNDNVAFSANVEVKSPSFPHDTHNDHKIIIPTVLLTDNGREKVKRYCKRHEIVFLPPRVLKLRDFLNSASKKFTIPKEKEVNLLYINWSYRDFPSNGYLEAWSLLTNTINGILTNPIYAKTIGVDLDVFKKVTAIIVYTESLEGLMFQSFEYVWQTNTRGPRFRMWVNRDIIGDDDEGLLQIIHDTTQMNPSEPLDQYLMADMKSKTDEDRISGGEMCVELMKIISENVLRIN